MSSTATERALTIGVDFDNTIVNYDDLLHAIAVDWGVLRPDAPKNKKSIRDTVRELPVGEVVWQRLQIAAYGLRMREAVPSDGVKEFFRVCKERAIPLRIVSHKTAVPNLNESSVNLRDAALRWLGEQGFLSDAAFGIGQGHVYFESTRREKIARIAALGVTHFIDDLEETFDDPTFPPAVEKILYAPGTSWMRIAAQLFQR